MNDKLKKLYDEQKELESRLCDIDKEIRECRKENATLIQNSSNISATDRDKRCGRYCDDCIIPCSKCMRGVCEQCSYGYKDIVERLKTKYNSEELESLTEKCPYAVLACNN